MDPGSSSRPKRLACPSAAPRPPRGLCGVRPADVVCEPHIGSIVRGHWQVFGIEAVPGGLACQSRWTRRHIRAGRPRIGDYAPIRRGSGPDRARPGAGGVAGNSSTMPLPAERWARSHPSSVHAKAFRPMRWRPPHTPADLSSFSFVVRLPLPLGLAQAGAALGRSGTAVLAPTDARGRTLGGSLGRNRSPENRCRHRRGQRCRRILCSMRTMETL